MLLSRFDDLIGHHLLLVNLHIDLNLTELYLEQAARRVGQYWRKNTVVA
jgi:hypothetical protein